MRRNIAALALSLTLAAPAAAQIYVPFQAFCYIAVLADCDSKLQDANWVERQAINTSCLVRLNGCWTDADE